MAIDFSGMWTKANKNFVRRTLNKLEDDPHKADILSFIDNEVTNIWIILAYLAGRTKLERYAEIGVRRGFSMAIVGARRKTAELVGFDIWQAGYAGAPNPGADFVRSELRKVGHTGPINLISGDSALTVPGYQTDRYFPVVLADADHSTGGVYRDIKNSLRLVAPGGFLVVDDLQDDAVLAGWQLAISEVDTWTWQQDRVGIIRKG